MSLINVLNDPRCRFDQAAEHRLVPDDLGVVLDVGGGGHDVDQRGDVLHPARAVEVAAAAQLVAQGDGIDDVTALGERDHRAEQQPVAFLVEHRVVQDFGRFEGRILVEHHRAEDRLLRVVAPRSLAAGELACSVSARGGELRYGRHPRLVSSSWGSGAAPPGDR